MASYTDILPPPQNLDTLDAWGSLDELLWSLDDGIWETAGKYALAVDAAAHSGQGQTYVRIRTDGLSQGVAASGEAEGNILRELSLSGSAHMDGQQIGGVARSIPVDPATAQSEELLTAYRVRLDEPEALAQSGGTPVLYRVRTDSPADEVDTGEVFILYRLLTLIMPGWGQSAEVLAPEYKGWTWKQDPGSAESVWTQQTAEPEAWRQLSGTDNEWRSVVQWQ